MNINDYSKCSQCEKMFLYKELWLCDGIIFPYRELPFGKRKNKTCDRLICKDCRKHIAGYDFCENCYKRRI